MITKRHRFHGHNSLKYVYRNGQQVRGPLFSLKYLRNERRETYRLAVVVSRKVNKSSVVRNRIRRRIFEIVRHYESRIHNPYDIVITVFHESVAAIPHEELDTAVRTQLSQAKII